ncbi:hypothetical protein AB7942_11145 [Neobacillus sp. BF23-41]|uniref:hypothetical protein n=1 Tax=Neobacillus sp. BF23-41 TaxID=3240280 RepID=UPI0034E5C597
MFSFETDPLLVNDREDLIAVLRMRFGEISGEIIQKIYEIDDMNTLQRLIIAAANAASWNVFLEEFQSGENSFKILGEEFNPLGEILKGRGDVDAV